MLLSYMYEKLYLMIFKLLFKYKSFMSSEKFSKLQFFWTQLKVTLLLFDIKLRTFHQKDIFDVDKSFFWKWILLCFVNLMNFLNGMLANNFTSRSMKCTLVFCKIIGDIRFEIYQKIHILDSCALIYRDLSPSFLLNSSHINWHKLQVKTTWISCT